MCRKGGGVRGRGRGEARACEGTGWVAEWVRMGQESGGGPEGRVVMCMHVDGACAVLHVYSMYVPPPSTPYLDNGVLHHQIIKDLIQDAQAHLEGQGWVGEAQGEVGRLEVGFRV